jgi:malic enzyme
MIAMPGRIDDDWLTTAAHAVADSVTEEEMAAGMIYPRIARLPGVLTSVAAAIVGHAQGIDRSEALDRVRQSAWEPVYPDFD